MHMHPWNHDILPIHFSESPTKIVNIEMIVTLTLDPIVQMFEISIFFNLIYVTMCCAQLVK